MKKIQKRVELKVKQFMRDEGLFHRGDRLLLGVSGGPDSICLLHLMLKWAKAEKWELRVAHFDHQLRKSSGQESVYIEALCKGLGISCVRGEADTRAFQRKHKLSLEEAARHLRHEFFKFEAHCDPRESGDPFPKPFKIVLAHHLNDQVETFFVSLLKGCGSGGLSGMKATEGRIVRPLLTTLKVDILAYLESKKLHYFNDETNQDVKILRNRVRHKLLPYIEKTFDWNLEKTLPRMMTVLKAEHEVLEDFIGVWISEHLRTSRRSSSLNVTQFLRLPVALQRRVVKRVLDRYADKRNYSSVHIEENRRLFLNPVSHKKLQLPEGLIAEKLKKEVVWRMTGFPG